MMKLRGGGCAASKPSSTEERGQGVPPQAQAQLQDVSVDNIAPAESPASEDPLDLITQSPAPSVASDDMAATQYLASHGLAKSKAAADQPNSAASTESGFPGFTAMLGQQLSSMLQSTLMLAKKAPLSPEILTALTALDDRLALVLRNGDIRLMRSAWVLAQDPTDFRIPHRQALEAMEKSGVSPSPLLSPHEAEALLRRGQRCVGVLSQYAPHRCFQPGTDVNRCCHSLLLLLHNCC
jgi:hypothetical protein